MVLIGLYITRFIIKLLLFISDVIIFIIYVFELYIHFFNIHIILDDSLHLQTTQSSVQNNINIYIYIHALR